MPCIPSLLNPTPCMNILSRVGCRRAWRACSAWRSAPALQLHAPSSPSPLRRFVCSTCSVCCAHVASCLVTRGLQLPQRLYELLTYFNQDRREIPSSFRLIAHAFALLCIGPSILQPYPDNDCVLKLLACRVLMLAGFNAEIVYVPRLLDVTPEVFCRSLCS
jgi:hypothetical protein